jgi:hypothetical protein
LKHGRKYTIGNVDRSRYDRLVDLGWLTAIKTNDSDVEYHVTDIGRAVAEARKFYLGEGRPPLVSRSGENVRGLLVHQRAPKAAQEFLYAILQRVEKLA